MVPEKPSDPLNTMRRGARQWTSSVLIFLGCWLILFQWNFGISDQRIRLDDTVIGIAVIVLALLSFRYTWSRWILAILGIWLQLAPLLIWASSPAAYLNNVVIGILLVAFSVLIPRLEHRVEGPGEKPPGWSYNPSAWIQRVPILILASVCWFITQHMAAFQLGYLKTVWDPFFQPGTVAVLSSNISKMFPLPDAGLGSVAYLVEALTACVGDQSRWRTGPWLVFLFGLLVIPVGLISILLIMLQPLVVGAWCSWCLLTALCMLFMIALTIDEVWAAIQFLWRVRKGKDLWNVFWRGGSIAGTQEEESLRGATVGFRCRYAFRGFTLRWNLILSALVGVWFMFVPWELSLQGHLYAYYILGPLVICVSIIAMAEVVRPLRWVNLLFAVLVIVAIWAVPFSGALAWQHIAIAILIAFFSSIGRRKVSKSGY